MTKTKELEIVLDSVRTTLQRCQAENKRLLDILQYYGWTDWRVLSMTDRGEVARQILREIAGGKSIGIQNNNM